MKTPTTLSEAFEILLEQYSDVLSNNGCNDFEVANTPELYQAIEKANALNYGLSVEEWKKHEDYYEPSVSKDGTKIYTQDFTILALLEDLVKQSQANL